MKAFHCIVSKGLSCASSMPLKECIHFHLVPKRILGSWSSDKHLVFLELPSTYEEPPYVLFLTKLCNSQQTLPEAFSHCAFHHPGRDWGVNFVLQLSKLHISSSSQQSLSGWYCCAQMGNSKLHVPCVSHHTSWEVEASGKCSLALCTCLGQSVLYRFIRWNSGSWKESSRARWVSRTVQNREGITAWPLNAVHLHKSGHAQNCFAGYLQGTWSEHIFLWVCMHLPTWTLDTRMGRGGEGGGHCGLW